MLRPFLLIGIGGSGGKTLRIVRDELRRRLSQAGWTHDLPQGWQFLHIDVPSHADGNDPDLPPQLPVRDYAGLVAPSLTYRTIDNALMEGAGRTPIADLAAGWRPDPDKVTVPIEKGAGQFRALGRLVTVAGLKQVKRSIDQAVLRMGGAEVTGELQTVTRMLGGEASSVLNAPVAIVVSSIAGGSGAGAVIDVCDALRATGETWASESFGILYAPDVFDYLPEEKRRGVRPNALATLSELLAGYWNKEGHSAETAVLLEKQGIQAGTADRIGPRYSFLVGSRNEYVSYATQNDIYRAMGRSLSSWMSSSALQDRLEAYTQGNWAQTAITVQDNLPLKTSEMETPFTALGSARVGLGRDRFRDYAAERLARGAVERVLRRHEQLRERDDDRTERALIEDVAQPMFGSFIKAAQLEERSENNNDVLDALRPATRNDRLRDLVTEFTAAASANAPDKGRRVADWRELILGRLRDGRPDFLDACELEHRDQARSWVKNTQDRLVQVTAAYVAREGAPVTKELLAKLITELEQVSLELEQEGLKYRRLAADAAQYVDAQLREAGGDLVPATHPHIKQAVGRGVQALQWETEAQLRDLAGQLIPDLAQNVVGPLRDALSRGHQSLVRDDTTQTGQTAVTARWPQGEDVPRRLQPAPNEFLVDPVEDYPKTFHGIVNRTVAAKAPGSDVTEAIMQVVTGTTEVMDPTQSLIVQQGQWVPRASELHTSVSDTPARASFDFTLSAADLLDRANAWVATPASPIGRYVQEGLKDYLDPGRADPDDLGRREMAFEAQLVAALDAAQPLISINKAVLVQVHNRNKVSAECFTTEIPFPAKSRGREIVQRVMEGRGLWNAEVDKALGDSSTAAIDFFSALSEPYEPVVFDSLMKPIASEWGERSRNPDSREEFWRWRRSRQLAEFIPVAPPIRHAMIRGWFTAAHLGQLQTSDGRASIFVPSESGGPGRWMPFPDPLLVDDISADYEYLPVVLQSLTIALVDVSVEASLTPMAPYRRLRQLGESGGGGFDVYKQASKPLTRWIAAGEIPDGGPTPVATRAGSIKDEPDVRKKAAGEGFANRLTMHEARLFAPTEAREHALEVPLVWELRRDIRQALDQLVKAVDLIELSLGDNDGWV